MRQKGEGGVGGGVDGNGKRCTFYLETKNFNVNEHL